MVLLMVVACLVQAPETLDVTAVGKDARWQVAGRTTAVVDTNGLPVRGTFSGRSAR